MTERDMQNIVVAHAHVRTDLAIVPNCTVYGHESDVLRLTAGGHVWEYEVKITRADFLVDSKKHRHVKLSNTSRWYPTGAGDRAPQRFYYVAPTGVIAVSDLPAYAGLLVIDGATVTLAKRAPRLHTAPASKRVRDYLARGMTIRYWQERSGVNPLRDAKDRQREDMRRHREREREYRRQRDAAAKQYEVALAALREEAA